MEWKYKSFNDLLKCFSIKYTTAAQGRRLRCAKGEVGDRRRGTGSELRICTNPLHFLKLVVRASFPTLRR
jgi:hypothetical protein